MIDDKPAAALLKVADILQIGPPGTIPGTLANVERALELCNAVRDALPPATKAK